MTNISQITFANSKRADITKASFAGSFLSKAILCAYMVSLPPVLATEPFSGATIGNQIKESWAKQSASKDSKTKLAKATVETTIKAPKEYVWNALTDFGRYPRIFPKVKSCQVLKSEKASWYTSRVFSSPSCLSTNNASTQSTTYKTSQTACVGKWSTARSKP
jgi:uncharacterized membrane protein